MYFKEIIKSPANLSQILQKQILLIHKASLAEE